MVMETTPISTRESKHQNKRLCRKKGDEWLDVIDLSVAVGFTGPMAELWRIFLDQAQDVPYYRFGRGWFAYWLPRIPRGEETVRPDMHLAGGHCPECGAVEGELHHLECQEEECPACGGIGTPNCCQPMPAVRDEGADRLLSRLALRRARRQLTAGR